MNLEGNRNSELDTAAIPSHWQPRCGESKSAPASLISTILQAELQRYKQLQVYEKEKKELRESLIERYENGAQVERGELAVEVRPYQTRQLTKLELIRLLGEETVTGLIELVEPKTQQRLIVGDSEHTNSRPR